jgi:hypothetical protein
MLGSQWLQVRRSDILPDGDRKRSVSPGRCDPVCETDPRRLQASSNVATRFVGQHVGQFLSSTCGVAVATGSEEGIVEAIIERCAGLDVHQATVVVCVLIGEAGRKQTAPGEPKLFDPDPGPGGAAGLAQGTGRHACWHGEHGPLLEAGPCHPGRPFRADRRQRPPHPQRFRAQGPETDARPT